MSVANFRDTPIAFFTMEVALEDSLPTFSGGLGVLAGDFLRSAADLALPVVAVTLLYKRGYFVQHLDATGRQTESGVSWEPDDLLELLPERIELEVGERQVHVQAWRTILHGESGGQVPVLFLDTDLPENDPADRTITDQLYAGDQEHRLRQEAVLGLGGVTMLSALGFRPSTYHMNEGHCSLLTIGLLQARSQNQPDVSEEDVSSVKEQCVFTTHTPVPAGHDRFPNELVRSVLGAERLKILESVKCLEDGTLNMTTLGLRMSRYANGVSRRHGEVSRQMFPGVAVSSITNGVHAATWVGTPMQAVFDRAIPGWRNQNDLLRYVAEVSLDEIDQAHDICKRELVAAVRKKNGVTLDAEILTIGLARRSTPYKRTTLLFRDLDRLRKIVEIAGPLQVVCAGKAHPRDEAGKELICDIVTASEQLKGAVEVVFVEGYDLGLAKLLCTASDIWLNTPEKPHEASGTSGMKAALNGVPSLSVLDGWWIEGCVEGVTGWAIGEASEGDVEGDASALYDKLAQVVIPLYYGDREAFLDVRRNAIALNGSFFNTERMTREYALSAYRLLERPTNDPGVKASPP